MKTQNLSIKFVLVAVVVFALAGCDVFPSQIEENKYDGGDKVEFTPLEDVLTLAQSEASAVDVTAQLIGEQRGNDLTFGVSVVDSLTTAVSGDHYSLPSNSVTIPANSSSANYTINVTGANLSSGEVVTLAVTLEGTENVEPAENLKTYTLTLQGE